MSAALLEGHEWQGIIRVQVAMLRPVPDEDGAKRGGWPPIHRSVACAAF
jgi:hypothetical protein